MATLIMNSAQIPDKSILDLNGKQTYLGNSFISGVKSAAIGSTSETPYFLMINPASNGVSSSFKSMFNYVRKLSVITTTSAIATFRFYYNPTVTSNGTAVTPLNLRFNPNSPASVMQTFSLPSVSSNGTFIADLAVTSGGGIGISNLLFVLDPGQSILVTITESTGTVPVAFETAWNEF
jgi:hypothetical protein